MNVAKLQSASCVYRPKSYSEVASCGDSAPPADYVRPN